MKILVVWYDSFNYLNGITKALNTYSNVCSRKFSFEFFGRGAKKYERFMDKIGVKFFEERYYKKIKNSLIKECKNNKPDLIIILNAKYRDIFDDEFFQVMKQQGIKSAVWFVDSVKIAGVFNSEYLNKFNNIYSFEYSDVQYIQEKYKVFNVDYLPLGADTEIYKPCNNNSDKKYDVCFVGAYDEKRLSILEKVAEYCVRNNRNMVVYGHMWRNRNCLQNAIYENKFKKRYTNLHRFVVNKYLDPKDVCTLYQQSKICLNINRSVHSGANPRAFEIMATKSFQLVDYSEQIEMVFANNIHLAMYKNCLELEEQLDYYLKNDAQRERVTDAGYNLVMEKYTLETLVGKIIKNIN